MPLCEDIEKSQENQEYIDRVFCPEAGQPGHYFCGICNLHNTTRFECGCAAQTEGSEFIFTSTI